MENVSFIMAFTAGVFSFLSPCVLPLIPAYISYLTGVSFQDTKEPTKERKNQIRLSTALHALSFILGFTIVFVLLGVSVTFLGKLLLEYQPILKRIGGIFIIFFGLIIIGVIKIPFLQKQKKLSYKKDGVSILGSILVGATFAVAWTPCVGPILGSILVYASSTASIKMGIKLLIAFSLGLGLPFFISGLAVNSFLIYFKKFGKYIRWVTITAGTVFIIFGILLLTGIRL
ncbi:MAG: sulfite exporter TauE/SafE family protein [Candidatus Omnitrophica bacterium]|nr:sulfite exporter TauE/SafE family protein [Candidatus Omnitrophota bacterium]